MENHPFLRTLSIIIFAIGVLLGTTFVALATWADFEAILFNPGIRQRASIRMMRCPIVIAADETGTIRARFKNTLDRPTELFVEAHISEGYVTLMREIKEEVPLEPGEAQWVEWTVTADDAAFERFILFKATVRGGYPLPTRQGTCGVLVIDIPYLSGRHALALTLGISILGILGGGGLWLTTNRHRLERDVQMTRAMGLLTASVLAGIAVSLIGWWIFGALSLLVTLLAIGAVIAYFSNTLSP